MGNSASQSSPRRQERRSKGKGGEIIQHQEKGKILNYTNRYGSPFNRTQFLNHSATVQNNRKVKNSPMLSCITDEPWGEEVGNLNCIASSLNGDDKVNTLYDVKAHVGRQIVWEYQRFHPILGWGAANFEHPADLPLDAATNVRFASVDHEKFGDSIQSVAPPLPKGWKVDISWTIVVQRRTRKRGGRGGDVDETALSDKFGWRYANRFTDDIWVRKHQLGCNLRRRAWNRILMKSELDVEDDAIGDYETFDSNVALEIGEE